jgi:hypothetical protein
MLFRTNLSKIMYKYVYTDLIKTNSNEVNSFTKNIQACRHWIENLGSTKGTGGQDFSRSHNLGFSHLLSHARTIFISNLSIQRKVK